MKNLLRVLFTSLLLIGLSASNPANKKVVVLDIGHGGTDLGAHNENGSEKEITLAIAKRVKALAANSDIEIILSRDSDLFLSLADRMALVKEVHASAVLSLHVNTSNNPEHNGSEIYIDAKKNENKNSKAVAESINKNMPVSLEGGPVKKGSFYLLKNVNCAASILELGYLTNFQDLAYLQSEKGQEEIAKAIFEGLK